ncbi:Ldh family oxidoreductase [Allonocardiopsis opalescens]|uniref:Putative oxidoreductase n=1 Tax=Allonocardiopsis opalescens TaxID=1144618 RepID=A0A2T0PX84_9ACTN|nr:Ldh family oxidoreductase [Allonocardiopsis opalescens]PRX96153.1 putative oxidoreductase [Allonocardiopsis opalescens]
MGVAVREDAETGRGTVPAGAAGPSGAGPAAGAAGEPVHTVPAGELRALAAEVLRAEGASPADAELVAAALVEANLIGHDSHGVRRLPPYVAAVRRGEVDPRAVPEVLSRHGATVTIAGNRAFGQVAAAMAVRELADAAARHGVAVAVIRDCTHIGRLGEYVETLAREGHVAMALCNVDPTVAPFGGRDRRMGTNPMAWALPRAGGPPVVVDWATSAVAEGKLALALARGERVGPGLVVDPDGRPTTDPADFYRGGALLPFAGHKGYGLSIVIEVIGGLLTGTGISALPDYQGTSGTVLLALDVAPFVPPEEFREQVARYCELLRATPPAEGHREVLVPGDLEERARRERARDGIPLPAATWSELRALLAEPAPGGDAG